MSRRENIVRPLAGKKTSQECVCCRSGAVALLVAFAALIVGCPDVQPGLGVAVLATGADADQQIVVDHAGNVCTASDEACESTYVQHSAVQFEAVGDGFLRWECSGRTPYRPLRTSTNPFKYGADVVDGEHCVAIFCATRDVAIDVDVGNFGARAYVTPSRFTIRNDLIYLRVSEGEASFCNSTDSSCVVRVCEGTTVLVDANTDTLRFGDFSGDCSADEGDPLRTTILVDGDKSCTATYEPIVLEVGVTGNGHVVSSPAEIDCNEAGGATCVGAFPLRLAVDLHAQADPGASFAGWSGDCAGATETAQVVMDEDHQCTAVFEVLGIAPGEAGVVELASVAPDGGNVTTTAGGGAEAYGYGKGSDLSADGHSLVFRREPELDPFSGLPIPGPDNGILLRNLTSNSTELVVAANDSPAEGMEVSVDATGRYVAFVSGDPSLTGNPSDDRTRAAFVYDREKNQLQKVSEDDPAHSVALHQSGYEPAVMWVEISADGRYVVFSGARRSDNHNLIYVRDTCAGAVAGCAPSTRIVSVTASGAVPNQGWSGYPSISADGRFVTFASSSRLLLGEPDLSLWMPILAHDRDADGNGVFDETGSGCSLPPCIANRLVSPPNEAYFYPRISASGRFVAYVGFDNLGAYVEVFDTAEGTTRRLEGDGISSYADPHLSGDGRFIAFTTLGLVDVQTAVQDTCLGAPPGCTPRTRLVSLNAVGDTAETATAGARISGDGRLVSFGTGAGNLIAPYDFDYDPDVFVAASGFARTPGGHPTIERLPTNLQAGSPEQLVTVEGAGFVPGVSVLWNGESRPTIYIDATRLEIRATAADLALPKLVTLEVLNPGGDRSDPALMQVFE